MRINPGWSIVALSLASCVGELSVETLEDRKKMEPVPYGTSADMVLAADLERWLADRASWPTFSGMEEMIAGSGPHGALQKVRVNPVAASQPDLPNGSIVIIEGFANETATEPESVAVMQKVDGYDREHADWLWAVVDPAGKLAKDDNGIPLVGHIGAGKPNGCIGCHANAPGGDFVYSNEVQ